MEEEEEEEEDGPTRELLSNVSTASRDAVPLSKPPGEGPASAEACVSSTSSQRRKPAKPSRSGRRFGGGASSCRSLSSSVENITFSRTFRAEASLRRSRSRGTIRSSLDVWTQTL